MKLVRLALAVLSTLLVLALAPANAAANPGDLDFDFGGGGRVVFPPVGSGVAFEPYRSDTATAPDGSIYIADDSHVVRLRANGKLDLSFGSGGMAAIEAPPGFSFRLRDIAVDGSGRPLVFGEAVGPPVEKISQYLYPAPPTTSAMARRFQPSGAPDPSFADNGLLLADFGITAYYPVYQDHATGWLPTAAIIRARLDQRERIVLVVGKPNSGRASYDSARQVVRLGRNGFIDPGFGAGGEVALSDLNEPELALDRHGAITVAGRDSDLKVVLNRLRPNGSPDPRFGQRGRRAYGSCGGLVAIAANRAGELALLCHDAEAESQQSILRLHADGKPVRGFGRGGLRLLGAKQGSRFQILLDRRGRVLTLGVLDGGEGTERFQAIERLLANGSVDRGFGRRGLVLTGFQSVPYGFPRALTFWRTRLLAIGYGSLDSFEGPWESLLLTRYELGSR